MKVKFLRCFFISGAAMLSLESNVSAAEPNNVQRPWSVTPGSPPIGFNQLSTEYGVSWIRIPATPQDRVP